MSWTKYIVLNCDECFMEKDGLSFSVKEARKQAADWFLIDGKDICDQCAIKLYPGRFKRSVRKRSKSMGLKMPNFDDWTVFENDEV